MFASILRIILNLCMACVLVGCATLPRLSTPWHWHLTLHLSTSGSAAPALAVNRRLRPSNRAPARPVRSKAGRACPGGV
jgi:hypothetical protein